jgi:hypothetical protein
MHCNHEPPRTIFVDCEGRNLEVQVQVVVQVLVVVNGMNEEKLTVKIDANKRQQIRNGGTECERGQYQIFSPPRFGLDKLNC